MENQEVFTYFTGGPPPNWLEKSSWYAPVQVAPAETMPLVGLKKLDLKVSMCCMKCAEIVSEEIREVPGVLDVQVDYTSNRVTVIGKPYPPDVLKRAKKIDKKAHFLPPSPPAPKAEEPEKKEEKVEKKEEKVKVEKKEEKKEGKKDEKQEKKEEGGEKEKKEDKPKEPSPAPPPQAVQYPPYEYMVSRYPSFDYHPSQSYNPLLPYNPYPNARQLFYDWPHFRTAEGAEATFVPPPKPIPYQTVSDLWNIFQPP